MVKGWFDVAFCLDNVRFFRLEGLGEVQKREEDAAEGGFASGGVVPLGECVDAASGASGGEGGGGDAEGEGEVGVCGAQAEFGTDAEVPVDGAEGAQEGGVWGELRGGAVTDNLDIEGESG